MNKFHFQYVFSCFNVHIWNIKGKLLIRNKYWQPLSNFIDKNPNYLNKVFMTGMSIF